MKIEIENLEKSYGSKKVLKNINMEIYEGMFGLLGPNGAGKTTFMRILTTLLRKSGGRVRIDGIEIEKASEIRKIVGYLPQDFSMYPNLSLYEAMDYLAILSGIKNSILRKRRIIELLEVVNLENQYKTKVKALSGGMKRRLGIAQALIHNPSVLIVDEPTAGLDPEERIRFRNLLNDFAQNRIVILSTHIVEDVEFTCENLAVMREGNIIFQGKVKEMLKMAEGDVWTVILDRESLERLRRVYKIVSTISEGEMIKSRILSKTMPIESAERIQPSIEDAYLRLMGEGI